MKDSKTAIAANLRRLRLARGLTARQLGKLAGCSASFVINIESGDRGPGLKSLDALAAALRVDTADLLTTGGRR